MVENEKAAQYERLKLGGEIGFCSWISGSTKEIGGRTVRGWLSSDIGGFSEQCYSIGF